MSPRCSENMPQQKSERPNEERTTFGGLSRSALMARVPSRGNATTELRMVALLGRRGIVGWSRHATLVGHPDFYWPSEKIALFVHGCFWHGHSCGRNLSPNSNREAWARKIARNRQRDQRCAGALRRLGWSVLTVWECQLRLWPEECMRRIERTLARKTRAGSAT